MDNDDNSILDIKLHLFDFLVLLLSVNEVPAAALLCVKSKIDQLNWLTLYEGIHYLLIINVYTKEQ